MCNFENVSFDITARHTPAMTNALRIILVITLFASVVYYTVYAASIIAVFSVEVNPLKHVDDLVSKGFIFYGSRFSFKGLQYARVSTSKNVPNSIIVIEL